MTPTVRGVCTFAAFFSVSRPLSRFTLVYEGHFVLCYKEKIKPLDRAMANFKRSIGLLDFRCYLHVASLSLTPLLYYLPCASVLFGSFLLQDMFSNLQVFAFEAQNMTFL